MSIRRLLVAACIGLSWLAMVFPIALAASQELATPVGDDTSTPPDLPIALVLDDGSREGAFGVNDGGSRQFLWFNQLSRPDGGGPMALEEIWVLFHPEADLEEGAPIQLVVYLDPDGDPANGAQLLASYDRQIEIIDGVKFSTYPLPEPLEIFGAGDLLLGVVGRFTDSGMTPFPLSPAAIDTGSLAQRSWIALWIGDPPATPQLPPDLSLRRLDLTTPGAFMIRGYGRPLELPTVDIPALGAPGLALLALVLASFALRRLGRGAQAR